MQKLQKDLHEESYSEVEDSKSKQAGKAYTLELLVGAKMFKQLVKKFGADPIYLDVLQSMTTTELKKNMKIMGEIRGPLTLKALKKTVSKAVRQHEKSKKAFVGSVVRDAIYWQKPGRNYRMTKTEQTGGQFFCPACKAEMSKENFTRSEKLFCCPECGFKISTNNLSTKRVEIEMEPDGEIEISIVTDFDGMDKELVASELKQGVHEDQPLYSDFVNLAKEYGGKYNKTKNSVTFHYGLEVFFGSNDPALRFEFGDKFWGRAWTLSDAEKVLKKIKEIHGILD